MFNESNTIEQMLINALCGGAERVGERRTPYVRKGTTDSLREFGWDYVPAARLQRQTSDVFVEQLLRDALVRLNSEIAEQPDRADEVLYRLRAIHLAVGADGLVRSNENLASWLRNEKTMPFGQNGEHTSVRLIDYDHPENNSFIITNQYTFAAGELHKRFDVVLLVNGLPLVIGETKTPVRPSESWVDAAHDIHDDYEQSVPAMFVPNVFSFATDGHAYRYGSIRMAVDGWCPWRETTNGGMEDVRETVAAMLRPAVLLDILQNYTIFATDRRHRRIKIICRYQQYEAANLMVKRVVEGQPKKGLIWHFQGSGKSLLMVFAAQKLRMHPDLQNPTVLIVVDRVDLDTQITATFNASDVPNLVTTNSREELRRMLSQDLRKIIITTIHKFGEAGGMLNDRSNIIVMVDEAHRTQEGDLGRKMREALPNAFLFGLTGTPINRRDRNTFYAFGADDDEHGYMSRYSFQDSIRDKATLPLHFSAAEPRLKIDRDAIDEAFEKLTEEISEQDRNEVARRVRMSVLIKAPERIHGVVGHIVNHYQSKVEPTGLKAQVVTYDRECCVLYKRTMDELLAPEESAIVMHTTGDEYKEFALSPGFC